MHVFKYERIKLNSKVKQCIFIAYDQEEFSYRFGILLTKKSLKAKILYSLKMTPLKTLRKIKGQSLPMKIFLSLHL